MTPADDNAPPPAPADKGAATSHPPGLYVLFGAEGWERFSYYGMRALLVLYLTNHLKYERSDALEIYGLYTGLVYLTPFLGGLCADKWLGRRKAVLIGGSLMALGHLAMAFEPLLFVALGLLVAGNGFFKPNISTIVGSLYKDGDARRDGGFTIFYMGINLGAFLAPLACGTLGQKVGWHFGFSAAAIGMVAGLLVFVWGQKFLQGGGMSPRQEEQGITRLGKRDYGEVAVWVAVSAILVWGIIGAWDTIGPVWQSAGGWVHLGALGLLLTVIFAALFNQTNTEEKHRLAVIVILCFFNIFFWLGFEQAGGTMTLFADEQTDLALGWPGVIIVTLLLAAAAVNLRRQTRQEQSAAPLWWGMVLLLSFMSLFVLVKGAMEISASGSFALIASHFQSINPFFIIAMAPSMSRLWTHLDQGRFATSTSTKMAIGLLLLGLGFVVLFFGQQMASGGQKVSPLWLASVYALHTAGELCLSPIGLSMVTKLAPPRGVSLAMGVWFFSSAVAGYLAGRMENIVAQYHLPLYGVLVATSFGSAVLLFAITPLLKKWTYGRA